MIDRTKIRRKLNEEGMLALDLHEGKTVQQTIYILTLYVKEHLAQHYSNTGVMTLSALPSRDPNAYMKDVCRSKTKQK